VDHSQHYFGAGPAAIPKNVKQKIQKDIFQYGVCDSILELSHRSQEFLSILTNAQSLLRSLCTIPDNYHILFMPGGATLQFDAVPLNLAGKAKHASYLDTGFWSRKSATLASKYIDVKFIAGLEQAGEKLCCIDPSQWNVDKESAYLHVTPNETAEGVEFVGIEEMNVPVVADMTSCLLMQEIDISKFGLIYASTHKTLGVAGLTVVIVRDDLIGLVSEKTPDLLRYDLYVKQNSIVNTSPVFACYVMQLMLEWVSSNGGVDNMVRQANQRAELLYQVIDASSKFTNNVCPRNRSAINVAFTSPQQSVIENLLSEAKQHGLTGLEGYRLIGGIRASMYNGTPLSAVKKLSELIESA
jgi:phosphoserine aminotransferase